MTKLPPPQLGSGAAAGEVLGKHRIKPLTGYNCSSTEIVSPEKLSALRQECDELIATFVTIPKRSKESLS